MQIEIIGLFLHCTASLMEVAWPCRPFSTAIDQLRLNKLLLNMLKLSREMWKVKRLFHFILCSETDLAS